MRAVILGLGLFASVGAHAADLAVRAVPVPLPLFSWTGFYVGGQIGGATLRDRLVETDVCVPACIDSATGNPSGVIGGAHAGFNWQSGAIVFGIEADIEGASLSHTTIYPLSAPDTFGSSIPVQGSVRGRIGYAFNQVLIYATGGAAIADIEHRYFEAVAGATTPLDDQNRLDDRRRHRIFPGATLERSRRVSLLRLRTQNRCAGDRVPGPI